MGLEPVATENVSDAEPVGSQGRPVNAVQVRAVEVERAPDAGADQADLPVGVEPLVAEHAIGDGKPVAGQGVPVRTVQVRRPEVQLAPDAGGG